MSYFTLFFGQKYFLYTKLLVAPGHQFLVCVYFSHSYASEPLLRKYKNAPKTFPLCSAVWSTGRQVTASDKILDNFTTESV